MTKKASLFDLLILAVITMIGFYFRFTLSQKMAVWLDETTVYSIASTFPLKDLLLLRHWDQIHPPLLYMATRIIVLLQNNPISIAEMRFPFVILSSLTTLPLFFYARKIFNSTFAPHAVVLWYAISPFQIRAGYNMRPYAVLQFLFVVGLFAFKIENWKSMRNIILFNILFIFLFFWDYASLWYFLCFGIYIAHIYSYDPKKIFIFSFKLLPFFGFILAWLPILFSTFGTAISLAEYIKPSLIKNFIELTFFEIQTTPVEQKVEVATFGFFGMLALYTLFFSKAAERKQLTFWLILGLLPLLISYLFSIVKSPILASRNLLISSLCFMIAWASVIKDTMRGVIFASLITAIFLITLHRANITFLQTEVKIPIAELVSRKNTDIQIYLHGDRAQLEHPLFFALLQNGFKAVPREERTYIYSDKEYYLNFHDIDSREGHINVNNETSFFLSKQKDYSSEEIVKINEYCRIKPENYLQIAESSTLLLLPCQ